MIPISRGLAADLADAESNLAATGGRGVDTAEHVDMLRLVSAFALGLDEAADDVGMTYDDDPDSLRSRAYDFGRTIGRERLGIE